VGGAAAPIGTLGLLSAMITPAVLISACAGLILSTSTRLGRIVDRVRELSALIEKLSRGEIPEYAEERRVEAERQLGSHALRGRLIQSALTSFYFAQGIFVATTICTAITTLLTRDRLAPRQPGRPGNDCSLLRQRAPDPRDAPGVALGERRDGVRAAAPR
jgi:hypothetical protein